MSVTKCAQLFLLFDPSLIYAIQSETCGKVQTMPVGFFVACRWIQHIEPAKTMNMHPPSVFKIIFIQMFEKLDFLGLKKDECVFCLVSPECQICSSQNRFLHININLWAYRMWHKLLHKDSPQPGECVQVSLISTLATITTWPLKSRTLNNVWYCWYRNPNKTNKSLHKHCYMGATTSINRKPPLK